MTPFRIAAKQLAAFALPDACPRCLWLKMRVQHKLPWQTFPGIFGSLDAYTKRVVEYAVNENFLHQAWLMALPPVVACLRPPHHSQFQVHDAATGILLTGQADAIWRCRDTSHIIVDYKTAMFSPKQQAILPLYAAQLHAYKHIAERTGLAPVSRLYLLYAQPLTEQLHAHNRQNHRNNGFALGFQFHTHEIALQPGLIDGLLAQARALYDRASAPAGRPGCDDCTRLQEVLPYAA